MPNLEDLYDIETALEEGFAAQLRALFVSPNAERVFTRLNAVEDFQKNRPRVEVRVAVGQQNSHKALCLDGQERNDQWSFTILFQLVTEPVNVPADNTLHPNLRKVLRSYMSTAAQGTWNDTANFPYHLVSEALLEAGTVPTLLEEDGVEYSNISWSGDVAVRDIAGVGTAFNLALV